MLVSWSFAREIRIAVGISFSPVSYLEYPVCDIPSRSEIYACVRSLSSLSSRILGYIFDHLKTYYILPRYGPLTFNLKQVNIRVR